jgi:uncharacterized protein (TIGR00251 family)
VVVPVHAVPRSAKTRVLGVHGEAVKVALAAPPVEGAANAELCAGLAKVLGLPKRAVSLARGGRGKRKQIAVEGLDLATVAKKLAQAAED